jgi:hypothetical protein
MHNMEEEFIECFSFSKTCWLCYTAISVMLLRFQRSDLWSHNRWMRPTLMIHYCWANN